MNTVVCSKCGDPVSEGTCWHQVIGWEHKRGSGGTNYIALREVTGELMCGSCMMKLRSGVAANQLTL